MASDTASRVEWLNDFSAAISQGRAVRSDLAYLAGILEEAGNERLAERLERLSDTLDEAITGADGAVSRMIREYSQDSFDEIGKTLRVLLKTVGDGSSE